MGKSGGCDYEGKKIIERLKAFNSETFVVVGGFDEEGFSDLARIRSGSVRQMRLFGLFLSLPNFDVVDDFGNLKIKFTQKVAALAGVF